MITVSRAVAPEVEAMFDLTLEEALSEHPIYPMVRGAKTEVAPTLQMMLDYIKTLPDTPENRDFVSSNELRALGNFQIPVGPEYHFMNPADYVSLWHWDGGVFIKSTLDPDIGFMEVEMGYGILASKMYLVDKPFGVNELAMLLSHHRMLVPVQVVTVREYVRAMLVSRTFRTIPPNNLAGTYEKTTAIVRRAVTRNVMYWRQFVPEGEAYLCSIRFGVNRGMETPEVELMQLVRKHGYDAVDKCVRGGVKDVESIIQVLENDIDLSLFGSLGVIS
jgi:hypothetical protein